MEKKAALIHIFKKTYLKLGKMKFASLLLMQLSEAIGINVSLRSITIYLWILQNLQNYIFTDSSSEFYY